MTCANAKHTNYMPYTDILWSPRYRCRVSLDFTKRPLCNDAGNINGTTHHAHVQGTILSRIAEHTTAKHMHHHTKHTKVEHSSTSDNYSTTKYRGGLCTLTTHSPCCDMVVLSLPDSTSESSQDIHSSAELAARLLPLGEDGRMITIKDSDTHIQTATRNESGSRHQ